MGRNNRTRRQQKQRQKQRKQKSAATTKRYELVQLDELAALCYPITASLADGEPPPPSIMADWASSPISSAVEPLRTVLIGFIDYVFHEHTANGELACLTPYRRTMKRTDLAWLYPLLFTYCLISDNALVEGDVEALANYLHHESLPCDIEADCRQQIEALCAPFYLVLWLMGRPVPRRLAPGGLRSWLRNWLGDSPLRSLIPQLEKFLGLKHPKPRQKTVKALEVALSRIAGDQLDGDRDDEWQDGLGRLLALFLQQRLSVDQRQAEAWSDCPHLSTLAGLLETQTAAHWSPVRFENTNTATLNRLNSQVSTDAMPYVERLPLEAFKCRLLGRYADQQRGVGREDFERQLGRLLNLLSTGVPPGAVAFAERCLETTCEWLADEVGHGRLPPPTAERLRRLYRRRPDDYRVAALIYLATRGREPRFESETEISFHHIHFPLFFQALTEQVKVKDLLEVFYWPLTGEAKKALFTQCCRRLFLGMNPDDAERCWERWRQPLFDVRREPFAAIVKGQACETEALFYMTLAALGTPYGTHWLQADHVSSVVRSAADLLTKHASDFNQSQVIKVLNALTTSQHSASLFHTWEPVLTIITRIEVVDELQVFLRLALTQLNGQDDHLAAKYTDLYKICRRFPKLRQYLPGKKKATQRKKAGESSPYSTLDLFGDLS